MYSPQELFNIEEEVLNYERRYSKSQERQSLNHLPESAIDLYCSLKKQHPSFDFDVVLPIYCYTSQLKGNYFSSLVNYYYNDYEKDLYIYFRNWLEYSLRNLESYGDAIVYHHLQSTVCYNKDSLIMGFQQLREEVIVINKFLSCSKIKWPGHLITFVITPLANNSASKDLTILPGKKDSAEQEVTFNYGACFLVSDIVKVDDECYLIYLMEVDADTASPIATYSKQELSKL